VLATVSLGAGRVGAAPESTAPSKFAELSLTDSARLERQRAVVTAAVRRLHHGPSLTRTAADLPTLQRLLDEHAFAKTQTYELQCLGVAFGDVLASELSLRWVMVTDGFGTDPTLRLGKTGIQINALTMISKRVEQGEAVDLKMLLQQTQDTLARIRSEARKDARKGAR
jgi:hypothetical protein